MNIRKLTVSAVLLFAAPAVMAASGAASGKLSGSDLPRFDQPSDGNGNPLDTSRAGDVVFEVSGTTSPIQLVDELGAVVKAGELTRIVVSSGATTDFALPVDSANVSGFTTASAQSQSSTQNLGEYCLRTATTPTSCTYNGQFNNGLVIMDSTNTAHVTVYWRPKGGRR